MGTPRALLIGAGVFGKGVQVERHPDNSAKG